LSNEHYETPKADLTTGASPEGNSKRSSTTTWGVIFLILGLLGLAIAIFGFYAIMAMDIAMPGFDKGTLTLDSVLSIVSKFGLLGLGISMLSRGSWVKPMVPIGFVLSMTDTIFKAVAVIPVQASHAPSSQEVGVYFGFYALAAISTAIYIAMFFYLKSDASKREFNLE